MPLSPSERLALEDAVRITNAVMAGDGDRLRVATALDTIAALLVADDRIARHVLAAQRLDSVEELMDLPRVGETASFCNGHDVVLSGSR